MEHNTTEPAMETSPSHGETPDSRASRYHRSRLFGQTHRNKERDQEERLQHEIDDLQREHIMLQSLLSLSPHASNWRTAPGSAYGALITGSAPTTPVSEPSADILGIPEVSAAVAGALLEIIALRRNLIGAARRRTGGRRAVSTAMVNDVVRGATCAFQAEFQGADEGDARLYAQQQIRVLAETHEHWAACERAGDVDDGGLEGETEMRTVGRRWRKRVGPKRCTRCKKVKTAGSGHGRSKCDDGVSVALDIPYPAPSGYRNSNAGSGKG